MASNQQGLLRQLPSITELLATEAAREWAGKHPQKVVTQALQAAVDRERQAILLGDASIQGDPLIASILRKADEVLRGSFAPRIRRAINGTGIILHTGLGRAVLAGNVIDSLLGELKGCCTMAVDPESGERVERDELVEPLLCELTGAEAATVVNNNAAATLLVLSALAVGREVIVSRGQLIEIGGSFRLPEVMAQSGARLVEVGATNRTHLKDYRNAISERTSALMRVHPSNYRIVGFTSEPSLAELIALGRTHGIPVIDDLGAGALVDLRQFGLPHEPVVRDSIRLGADLVLFSGDKLIGAGQAGIIVGKRDFIQRIRKHPLMRAVRVDKFCVMVLERTLRLFREPGRLAAESPTYSMVAQSVEVLEQRAKTLIGALGSAAPKLQCALENSQAFLGSGSLPGEGLPSRMIACQLLDMTAEQLARSLRLQNPCVFGRIERDRVCLDMRTIRDDELEFVIGAFRSIAGESGSN